MAPKMEKWLENWILWPSYFSAIFFLFSGGGRFLYLSYFGPGARNLFCSGPTGSKPKPELEPPEPKPEPLEPFHPQTVTEPNRGPPCKEPFLLNQTGGTQKEFGQIVPQRVKGGEPEGVRKHLKPLENGFFLKRPLLGVCKGGFCEGGKSQ